MAALYIQMYEEMLKKHSREFAAFSQIHLQFQTDQNNFRLKSEFDRLGKPVLDIIQQTLNDLCRKMENTSRGKYSSNLSDKFMSLVRSQFPMIDLVGVTIS